MNLIPLEISPAVSPVLSEEALVSPPRGGSRTTSFINGLTSPLAALATQRTVSKHVLEEGIHTSQIQGQPKTPDHISMQAETPVPR